MAITAVLAAIGGQVGGLGPERPSLPRTPLGAFPEPITYSVTLPFTPPAKRDLLFYRGNFCGLRIPGAPVVPGCNANHPEVIMACLLDNYPAWFQEHYLETYTAAGYTHLQRSIGHALYYGHDLNAYNALSRKARAYGLFCDHWILGGEALNTPDQTVDYWRPILEPILDSILASGTMDLACVGWQLDQYNIPGNVLIAIIAYVAEKCPASVPVFTHWVNEALAWWKDGGEVWRDAYQSLNVHDRFSWWYA